MKVFDKWYKEWEMPGDKISHKCNAQAGWRFALEYILACIEELTYIEEVEATIKDELKNEKI